MLEVFASPQYLGNFSAVEPVYSKEMCCAKCNVTWTGCWDNFMCPICEEGELPSVIDDFNNYDFKTLTKLSESK